MSAMQTTGVLPSWAAYIDSRWAVLLAVRGQCALQRSALCRTAASSQTVLGRLPCADRSFACGSPPKPATGYWLCWRMPLDQHPPGACRGPADRRANAVRLAARLDGGPLTVPEVKVSHPSEMRPRCGAWALGRRMERDGIGWRQTAASSGPPACPPPTACAGRSPRGPQEPLPRWRDIYRPAYSPLLLSGSSLRPRWRQWRLAQTPWRVRIPHRAKTHSGSRMASDTPATHICHRSSRRLRTSEERTEVVLRSASMRAA